MDSRQFFEALDARIAKYDLLCHPFYQAWAAGQLTREDLQEYARNYYHHVEAFPTYLAELGIRLDESDLRRAILANMADEKGLDVVLDTSSTHYFKAPLDITEDVVAAYNKAYPITAATAAPKPAPVK